MQFLSKILARLNGGHPSLANKLNLIYPLVDAKFYQIEAEDFSYTKLTAAEHYLRFGCKLGVKPNEYFDPQWYASYYPDVRKVGAYPLIHYAEFGWKERRNPSSRFYADAYLLLYPDVFVSGRDPLAHYLEYGAREGRSVFPVGFDLTNYIASAKDPMPPPPLYTPCNNGRPYRQFSTLVTGEICA